jgi:hypothetical protein
MKFATRVYLIAGIIGLIEMIPLYFSEALLGRLFPPAITHPDLYYGFAGVTLAWQVLFLMLSRDPLRYRPLMLATMIEKATYVGALLVLIAQQRIAPEMLGVAIQDGILGLLFVIAYVKTGADVTQQDTRTARPTAAS